MNVIYTFKIISKTKCSWSLCMFSNTESLFTFNGQFFPKSEKYVSLFIGGEDANITERRNALRKQIKSNLMDAAASGKDLEG